MTPALKEWGAAVHALLDGRQCVLLRKGGIHEKRFEVGASRFLFFPTYAHTHAESTRPEHRDLLPLGAADAEVDTLTVRAGAQIVAAIPVARPDAIGDLERFHIWTTDSVQRNRLVFRPRHQLTVLVVNVVALPEPAVLARLPEYAGCRSWIDLELALPRAAPASTELLEIADQVRTLVG
jgi:hypothetical protein